MMLAGTELQVLVATRPVDFRKQADTLAALVQEALAADPYSGAVYVFRAKRADRVKLLWWDGTGVCLMTKRLEGGQFRWPRIEDGVMRLTPAQLAALLEGTEWVRVGSREVERPRAAS
jgi:transposase